MKNRSSLRARAWAGLDLQSRLFLVFTSLFLFSVLVISLFLFNQTRMVALNTRTRVVFEQNRQVYSLYGMTQQYELAMNNYELNANELARIELEIKSAQIDETVSALRPSLSAEDRANLDQFAADKQQLSAIFTQIADKVDEEDWSSVLELDGQAYDILSPMYEQIDMIGERGVLHLNQVREEVDRFDSLILISMLLALPIFLVLAGITALVIYAQINQPLEQLARAAENVLNGTFDKFELEKMAARSDEVGYIAGEFLAMDGAVDLRAARLTQEIDEIRTKIHE